ncbi:MAG: 4a-hydroxytetrahydrobiopterin dehydratase [Thermoanaerobaculaceae bacterium]|nr:4a-hydroxytetrahydrobiopterin dehydratase [Thermoanaerobaculaceae bacterium]
MSDATLDRVQTELPGWQVEGRSLVARWRFPDFSCALAAAVRVGMEAERAAHHPDLSLGWGYLQVSLTTHDAAALTARDVDPALRIQVLLGRP